MALHLTVTEEKNMVILDIAGRIDTFSIDELNDGFDQVMKTGIKNVLLIMKDLEYINSRGIGTLISFLKWVKKVGGLVKIAEVPINIMQVLNFIGLDGLTLIYESASDAKISFQRQQTQKEDTINEVEVLKEEQIPVSPQRQTSMEKSHRVPLIALTVVVVIGIALMVLFFEIGRDKSLNLDITPLVNKLDTLERRLIRLEEYGQDSKDVVEEVTGLKESMSRRVNQLANDVDQLKKIARSLPQPKKEIETVTGQTSTPKPVTRYHSVREGESLFSIGRQYGLSVEELRRFNHINEDQYLRTGQKLIVGYARDSSGESHQ